MPRRQGIWRSLLGGSFLGQIYDSFQRDRIVEGDNVVVKPGEGCWDMELCLGRVLKDYEDGDFRVYFEEVDRSMTLDEEDLVVVQQC